MSCKNDDNYRSLALIPKKLKNKESEENTYIEYHYFHNINGAQDFFLGFFLYTEDLL